MMATRPPGRAASRQARSARSGCGRPQEMAGEDGVEADEAGRQGLRVGLTEVDGETRGRGLLARLGEHPGDRSMPTTS